MLYQLTFSEEPDLPAGFLPWQPSTWPSLDSAGLELAPTLRRIFECTILGEINNVISDAEKSGGSLEFRGHVVAIALLCALDAISSYGYCSESCRSGKQIPKFVRAHFPQEYGPHAKTLLRLCRHAMGIAGICLRRPFFQGRSRSSLHDGTLPFGLKRFFHDLCVATGR